MLDTYTVSFFGHRELKSFTNVYLQLESLIRELVDTKQYVEFLVGRNGEFDSLVSSIIRQVKREYRDDNSSLVLVLPYYTKEYGDNIGYFENYFDEVEICSESSRGHFKAAIQVRNKSMVDRSDLTIFYVEEEKGGAYSSYKYAKSKNKKIIRLSQVKHE